MVPGALPGEFPECWPNTLPLTIRWQVQRSDRSGLEHLPCKWVHPPVNPYALSPWQLCHLNLKAPRSVIPHTVGNPWSCFSEVCVKPIKKGVQELERWYNEYLYLVCEWPGFRPQYPLWSPSITRNHPWEQNHEHEISPENHQVWPPNNNSNKVGAIPESMCECHRLKVQPLVITTT